jgi:hypothetical protein
VAPTPATPTIWSVAGLKAAVPSKDSEEVEDDPVAQVGVFDNETTNHPVEQVVPSHTGSATIFGSNEKIVHLAQMTSRLMPIANTTFQNSHTASIGLAGYRIMDCPTAPWWASGMSWSYLSWYGQMYACYRGDVEIMIASAVSEQATLPGSVINTMRAGSVTHGIYAGVTYDDQSSTYSSWPAPTSFNTNVGQYQREVSEICGAGGNFYDPLIQRNVHVVVPFNSALGLGVVSAAGTDLTPGNGLPSLRVLTYTVMNSTLENGADFQFYTIHHAGGEGFRYMSPVGPPAVIIPTATLTALRDKASVEIFQGTAGEP